MHPFGPSCSLPSRTMLAVHGPHRQEVHVDDALTVLPDPPLDVDEAVRRTERMLAAGIPLTLLLDLMEPGGPDSRALYAAEL